MTTNFLTVKQFSEKHKAFPQGCLRALIFNEKKNNFDKVVRRIGGKVVLCEQSFFEWVEAQNGNGGTQNALL